MQSSENALAQRATHVANVGPGNHCFSVPHEWRTVAYRARELRTTSAYTSRIAAKKALIPSNLDCAAAHPHGIAADANAGELPSLDLDR